MSQVNRAHESKGRFGKDRGPGYYFKKSLHACELFRELLLMSRDSVAKWFQNKARVVPVKFDLHLNLSRNAEIGMFHHPSFRAPWLYLWIRAPYGNNQINSDFICRAFILSVMYRTTGNTWNSRRGLLRKSWLNDLHTNKKVTYFR